jgi:hypothetical protein
MFVVTQYRFCPNMIVIDTPGLLSAPGKLRHLNEQQRALQQVRAGAEFQVVCL